MGNMQKRNFEVWKIDMQEQSKESPKKFFSTNFSYICIEIYNYIYIFYYLLEDF